MEIVSIQSTWIMNRVVAEYCIEPIYSNVVAVSFEGAIYFCNIQSTVSFADSGISTDNLQKIREQVLDLRERRLEDALTLAAVNRKLADLENTAFLQNLLEGETD